MVLQSSTVYLPWLPECASSWRPANRSTSSCDATRNTRVPSSRCPKPPTPWPAMAHQAMHRATPDYQSQPSYSDEKKQPSYSTQPSYGGQSGYDYGGEKAGYASEKPGYGSSQSGYNQPQPGYAGGSQTGYDPSQPGYGQSSYSARA